MEPLPGRTLTCQPAPPPSQERLRERDQPSSSSRDHLSHGHERDHASRGSEREREERRGSRELGHAGKAGRESDRPRKDDRGEKRGGTMDGDKATDPRDAKVRAPRPASASLDDGSADVSRTPRRARLFLREPRCTRTWKTARSDANVLLSGRAPDDMHGLVLPLTLVRWPGSAPARLQGAPRRRAQDARSACAPPDSRRTARAACMPAAKNGLPKPSTTTCRPRPRPSRGPSLPRQLSCSAARLY